MSDQPKTKTLNERLRAEAAGIAFGNVGNDQTMMLLEEAAFYVATVEQVLADQLKSIREHMTSFGVPAMSQDEEDKGEVSDGYHTFNELYEHRHMLFLAMMGDDSIHSWFALLHDDGKGMEGWFIAGCTLGHQPITYHLPTRLLPLAFNSGARYLDRAPRWDGHTSADVIKRIENWLLA